MQNTLRCSRVTKGVSNTERAIRAKGHNRQVRVTRRRRMMVPSSTLLVFSLKFFINPQVWSEREPQPVTHINTLFHKHTQTQTASSFLKKKIPTNLHPRRSFLSPQKSEVFVVCIYLSMQVFGMLDFELKLQSLLWLGTWDGVEKKFFFFHFFFHPSEGVS